jgi:S-DNA-T family DNA segregation ATPase FtsK/SpoIIIE
VAGPRRSGRSTTLTALGRAALEEGQPVVGVTTRGGGLTGLLEDGVPVLRADAEDDVAHLVALRRGHPDLVVLVDDGEAVDGTPVHAVLREITDLVERDGGLVAVAADSGTLPGRVRGLAVDVARHRTGLLLMPSGLGDGALFGVRPPPGPLRIPGRGLLVAGGDVTEVQVLL